VAGGNVILLARRARGGGVCLGSTAPHCSLAANLPKPPPEAASQPQQEFIPAEWDIIPAAIDVILGGSASFLRRMNSFFRRMKSFFRSLRSFLPPVHHCRREWSPILWKCAHCGDEDWITAHPSRRARVLRGQREGQQFGEGRPAV